MAAADPAPKGQVDVKKRARRRLVGAIALALLAVIILPMVMDREPKPLTKDIAIRIPSRDSRAFHQNSAPAPPAPATALKTAPPAKAPTKPHSRPAPPPPKAPPPAKSSKSSRASKVSKASKHWVLQLGAYEYQSNVEHLVAVLKRYGYPSYTEKVHTAHGERTRVRGGPFDSRAAAARAQARLKKIGAGGPPGGVIAEKP